MRYLADNPFYASEGTSGGILKSNRPPVRPSVRPYVRPSVSPSFTNCVSAISHKLLNYFRYADFHRDQKNPVSFVSLLDGPAFFLVITLNYFSLFYVLLFCNTDLLTSG